MIVAQQTRKQPLRIIIDSNAFFIPLQLKIDIFAETERLLNRNIELILISPVKRELEMLEKKSSLQMRKNAAFALQLAQKCTYIKVRTRPDEPTDEAILRVAQNWKIPVLTNDKLLKQKLRDISIPTIYVREKSRLEIDGLIS